MFIASASRLESNTSNLNSSVKYNKLVHDFGNIEQGEIVDFTFTYVNQSSIPFTLKDVVASCGCTTTDWNRAPLMKGKQGKIRVEFNSRGREDEFEKDVFVLSNQGRDTLTIKGHVIAPNKEN